MVGALGLLVSDLPLDTKTEMGFPSCHYSTCKSHMVARRC